MWVHAHVAACLPDVSSWAGGRTRAALDAAGLDQLGEAVLVVVGLEPRDLGVDLGLEVVAAAAGDLAPLLDVVAVGRLPALLAALSIATWNRGWRTALLDRRPSRAMTWAGMSRHQITVMRRHQRSPPARVTSSRRRRARAAGRESTWIEAAQARRVVPVRGGARTRGRGGRRRARAIAEQLRVVGLGEVDEAPVVRRSTSARAPGGGRCRGRGSRAARSCGRGSRSARTSPAPRRPSGEGGAAGEELVAVGARQALDALLREDRVEQPAGAAVGIGDEDPLVAVARGPRGSAPGPASGIRSGRLCRSAAGR